MISLCKDAGADYIKLQKGTSNRFTLMNSSLNRINLLLGIPLGITDSNRVRCVATCSSRFALQRDRY